MLFNLKNVFSKQKSIYLNQMILPKIDEPIQIEPLYLNCHYAKHLQDTIHDFPHIHTFFEMHLPVNQKMIYEIDGEQVTIEEGQLLIIPPNVEHHLLHFHPELIKFGFAIAFFASQENEFTTTIKQIFSSDKYLIVPYTEDVQHCLIQIMDECDQVSPYTPYLIRDYIVKLLINAALFLDCEKILSFFPEKNVGDQRVIRIKQFIRDNINKPIDSTNVANYMHMSNKQCSRIFQKSEKISISKFIASVKINEALMLLKNSDKLIKEIGVMLGFNSEKSFSAFFKKHTQRSPSDFRKKEQYRMK